MIKPIILFEGMDCVGKTTIHKLFDKTCNYKYLTFERFFMTYYSYARRYSRELDYNMLSYYEDLLKDKMIIVYLTVSKEEQEKRILKTGHEKINYEEDKKYFDEFVKISNFKILEIDTSILTPGQIVYKILSEIENE